MQLLLDYPSWFILFCFLAGIAGSAGLYWFNKDFSTNDNVGIYAQGLLAFLRFLSITLLCFLLLSPLLKQRSQEARSPIIVYAHDNSSSVLFGLSGPDSSAYLNNTNSALSAISEKYDIDYYTFDNEIRTGDTLDFQGKATNLSNVLEELEAIYFNQNVGAVILSSDGIYNEGMNPVYSNSSFPIYTIGLGDTIARKDLKISAVNANKIAYLGDKLKVEVQLEAYSAEGAITSLSLYRVKGDNITKIGSKSLSFKENYEELSLNFTVNLDQIGIQRFRVLADELPEEISIQNNSMEFYVDVIDSRQKILLLANAPHPDIAALKNAIESNENYEVKAEFVNQFNADIEPYSLIVLHQLPSITNRIADLISKSKKNRIPLWYISGKASNYTFLNEEQDVVGLQIQQVADNDVRPALNLGFNAFKLSEETLVKLKRFPPIAAPFGNFVEGPGATTLFYQKIGAIETDYPLVSFSETFGSKTGLWIGEGFWRWRMYDFLDNGNHNAFDELVSKTVNYLALKTDKRRFRASSSTTNYYEGEDVIISAELYSESYELVSDAIVDLMIVDDNQVEYPFSMTSNPGGSYSFRNASLPEGNYTFTASTSMNGKSYDASGAFSISVLQLEDLETRANHDVLKQVSKNSDGTFYLPEEISSLSDELLQEDKMKTILYESFQTIPIINLWWIFLVLVLSLSIEWFFRKYMGAY